MTKTKSVPIRATWYKTNSGKYYMDEVLEIDVPEELLVNDPSILGRRYYTTHRLAREAVLEHCEDPYLFAVIEDIDKDCPAGDENDILSFPEVVYHPERKDVAKKVDELTELASELLRSVKASCLDCPNGNATPTRPCTNMACGFQDTLRRAHELGVS